MTPRIVVSAAGRRVLAHAEVRVLARRIRSAARAMGCVGQQIDGIELRIVDDEEMRGIKAKHFGVAEATDVLSFPAGDAVPGDPESEAHVGEIVLNRDAVARQATQQGARAWSDEATSLAIHGVAHLLGHDHHERRAARRMRACEGRGCRAVGLACNRPYGS